MARAVLTVLTAAGLSFWAAAQVPPIGPSVAEQARMLSANRAILSALIADGLAVSEAGDDPLGRIDACRKAANTLTRALDTACQDNIPDADRIAELSDHLGELLTDGLLAALALARTNYHEGSPDYPRFRGLSEQAAADAKSAIRVLPSSGRLAEHPQVRAARLKLASAAERFPE